MQDTLLVPGHADDLRLLGTQDVVPQSDGIGIGDGERLEGIVGGNFFTDAGLALGLFLCHILVACHAWEGTLYIADRAQLIHMLAVHRQIDTHGSGTLGAEAVAGVHAVDAVGLGIVVHFAGQAVIAAGDADDAQILRLLAVFDVPTEQSGGTPAQTLTASAVITAGNALLIPDNVILVNDKGIGVVVNAGEILGEVAILGNLAADNGELLGIKVKADEIPGAVVGKVHTLSVGSGLGAGHVAIPGVVVERTGIVRHLIVQILEAVCLGVDAVVSAGLGAAVEIAVGSQGQTEVKDLSCLAQILCHGAGLAVKGVDVTAHEADHVETIMLGIIFRTVDGLTGYRHAPVFGGSGIGIVVHDDGTGKAFPHIGMMGKGHPFRMLGRLVGVVGGGDDVIAALIVGRTEVDGGMELGMGHEAGLCVGDGADVHALIDGVVLVVVAHKLCMVVLARLGGKRIVKLAVGRENAVPAAVVILVAFFGRDGHLDAGLIDQPVGLFIMEAFKQELLCHV